MDTFQKIINRPIVRYMILASVLLPVLYISIRLLITQEDSIVLFADSPVIVPFIVLGYYGVIGIVGVVYLILEVMSYIRLKSEMKKSELTHLQTQVNPHFFFNMLNNLYGLIDKDALRAKELVLGLSDMMRYSIYDGQRERVTIGEEVDYMGTYIQLHEMRYHKEVDLRLETDIEDDRLEVLPLMFIILLENAVKHGVEHLRDGAYVHARLSATQDSVIFDVMNNFDPEEVSCMQGLGLKNLKRRLEIAYPRQHQLTHHAIGSVYQARLEIIDL